MTVCIPVLNGKGIFYTVQPGLGFLADAYYRARTMCHTGIDLNDTRGGDSDFGAPVYAAADGVVVDAASYRGWGNIIVIHHPALSVWTMYAHLSRMDTRSGAPVTMGQQIGAIGKGDKGQFLAHLHFEVRKVELPSYEWPSNQIKDRASCEGWIRERYFDPEVWLAQQKALKTLSEVQAYRSPPVPAAPAAAPLPLYLYSQNRNPDGSLRPDWTSIAVDAAGRVLLGGDKRPRTFYMPPELAAAKGLK